MQQDEIEIPTLCSDESQLPHYGTEGAAGADVRSSLENDLVIEPGDSALIPTGLRFEIPEGYEIQVRPRSGLAFKHQVTVLNTPGTIDHDYRGELKVILINHGKEPFSVTPGMRLAQIVVAPVTRGQFTCVKELVETARGAGGFGSTGTA